LALPQVFLAHEKEKGMKFRLCFVAIAVVITMVFTGCSALSPHENRKITAWGLWYAGAPGVLGLGYWHSERGEDVKSEQSAKPPKVMIP